MVLIANDLREGKLVAEAHQIVKTFVVRRLLRRMLAAIALQYLGEVDSVRSILIPTGLTLFVGMRRAALFNLLRTVCVSAPTRRRKKTYRRQNGELRQRKQETSFSAGKVIEQACNGP